MTEEDTFEHIGKSAMAALAMVKTRMEEAATLKDQANEIADRIGSEDHHRMDGALYEARAEAAQKKVEQAHAWARITESLAQNQWAKLRDEDCWI